MPTATYCDNWLRKEAVMKTMKLLMAMMAGSASAVFAAAGTQGEDMGILAYMFIGFFALVVVSQLVPAMILFFGMVKALFSRSEKSSVKADS
jgi:hypothetical protein